MRLLRKTKILTALPLLIMTLFVMAPVRTQAQAPPGCETGSADSMERCSQNYIEDQIRKRCSGMSADAAERCAANTKTSIQEGDFDYDGTPDNNEDTSNFDADCKVSSSEQLDKSNCGIISYLLLFINALTAIVGIVSVIMITVWGIQYSVSRDNPQMVASARLHILQTVLAVVIYLFVYAFLQWIVPGGIF